MNNTASQPTVDAPAAGPDDAQGAYLAALLTRVETLDGGQALAVVLASILDRLDRIEEFATEAQDAITKFGALKLPFGLGKLNS